MKNTLDVSRVIVLDPQHNILLEQRDTNCSNNPGLWEIPGGKCEPGEDATMSGVREVCEETGQDELEILSPAQEIARYTVPDGKHAGKICRQFVSIARIHRPTASPVTECTSVVWAGYANALESYALTKVSRSGLIVMGAQLIRLCQSSR